jgi:hypothetical protein
MQLARPVADADSHADPDVGKARGAQPAGCQSIGRARCGATS